MLTRFVNVFVVLAGGFLLTAFAFYFLEVLSGNQKREIMLKQEIAKAITEPGGLMPSDMELISLAGACTTRLATRMETKQRALPA